MRMNECRVATMVMKIGLAAAVGVAALGVSAGLTGCGSGDRAIKSTVDHDAWASVGYRVAWEGYPEMGPGGRVKFFQLLGDVIVVHDTTNIVSVLEAESGIRRWSDQPAPALTKFVGNARSGERLYVSSESEVFIYDIQTSTLTDRQNLKRVVNTKPAVAGDMLVYGTAGGFVLGHLVTNGITVWTNSFMDQGSIQADPILVSTLVGLVSQEGGVMFLDPLTGSSTGRAKIYGGTDVELASSDDLMFIASTDHSLYAFAARDGRQVWRKRTGQPLMHAPTHLAGRVFAALPGHGMTAMEAATGSEIWSNPQVEGRVIGLRDNNLMVWDRRSQTMTLLDPRDGAIVSRVWLQGVQDIIAASPMDGDLYVVWPRGVVGRFVPRS